MAKPPPGSKDTGLQFTTWGTQRVFAAMLPVSVANPLYPAELRRDRIMGEVTLEALIDTTGKPTQIRIFRSSGYERFDSAAMEAFRHWRFPSWKEDGVPTMYVTRQVISFNL